MQIIKRIFLFLVLIGLTACFSPSKPIIHFASENSIALKYSAYDALPTVTAEALDMAVKHCEKHGKGMKLVSSNAANLYTTTEIHTFMCTNDFVDKRIEVKVKD
jgi:hypothetical protein